MCIGKTRDALLTEGIKRYTDRVSHYIGFEFLCLPDIKGGAKLSEQQQKEREGAQMLSMLQPGDFVVLLDERGKELTSREFALSVEQRMNAGLKRLVYVIGGPYGFSDDMYDRANAKLSLSRMTFSHEMVRLFFVEQIYRAMTIMRGEPYHHD